MTCSKCSTLSDKACSELAYVQLLAFLSDNDLQDYSSYIGGQVKDWFVGLAMAPAWMSMAGRALSELGFCENCIQTGLDILRYAHGAVFWRRKGFGYADLFASKAMMDKAYAKEATLDK